MDPGTTESIAPRKRRSLRWLVVVAAAVVSLAYLSKAQIQPPGAGFRFLRGHAPVDWRLSLYTSRGARKVVDEAAKYCWKQPFKQVFESAEPELLNLNYEQVGTPPDIDGVTVHTWMGPDGQIVTLRQGKIFELGDTFATQTSRAYATATVSEPRELTLVNRIRLLLQRD